MHDRSGITDELGQNSPHLDRQQKRQAAAGAPLGPIVIHEIVREQGARELTRPFSGLAWSGLAAGLSIGFSFLLQSVLHAGLPDTPWRHLVSGFGYSLGFLIVILGRQQLFTETTLTAMIPFLTQPSLALLRKVFRVWVVVLTMNLVGTLVFGVILARGGLFPPETMTAMSDIAHHAIDRPFWKTVLTAGSAGWLIGLMVWLLPGAGPARPLIIILLTYAIAACTFPHIIAGSVEVIFLVATGQAGLGDYFGRFLVPTFIGNALGGVILTALLNHAPLAPELHGDDHGHGH
ncbi:MAG: formate/nitrite transporter family protein [Acetobacteraceae bacterium]